MNRAERRLDESLEQSVANLDVPMVVAAITTSRQIVYANAFGSPAARDDQPPNVDSVFYVASMAKPITTAAALKIAEEGRLSLDLPLKTWLPGASRLQVLEGLDARGEPVYRAPRRPITVRDLITHSAGFAHPTWNSRYLEFERRVTGGVDTQQGADVFSVPLMFDPGLGWEYSGTAINILGNLIEEISETPIGDFLKKEFFEPLRMVSTGWDLSQSMAARRIGTFERQTSGGFKTASHVKPRGPVKEYGAGGLYSTAVDYLSFLRMLLNDGAVGGERLLSAATVETMATPQFRDASVGCLRTTDPSIAKDVTFFPGQRKSWGYGFLINDEDAVTGRSAGSLSWFGALNTYFWLDRSRDAAGVFLTQLKPCADERALSAFARFEGEFYGAT